MADAVVSVFLEKLVNSLAAESSIVFQFKDQFEKLRNELQLMQSFLKDANRLKRKHDTLRTIMADLRELIYEAEDILAGCDLRSNNNKAAAVTSCSMWWYFSPSDLPFRYLTGKRLKEINDKITNIKHNISSYLGGLPLILNQTQSQSSAAAEDQIPRWSSPLYDHNLVVGLEEDRNKIKEWLMSKPYNDLLAIGIVGMGGVGKTTLAQKVFNDRQVEDYYDLRMWVSVSQTFTEEHIMRSMLKNLGDASVDDDRGELLRKINQYLQGKRYLIVMDDVWRKDNSWWIRISEGLPKGTGSVIITTRNEEVALRMRVAKDRIHQPSLLSEVNSWLLFRKIAFAGEGGECKYLDLESVGKEMVRKCKGLPLAIKAVAGMMLCKPPYFSQWRRIADNLPEELAEYDESVKASLQLSYDELPSYLKSCLLCFSLYPEDCVISKEQLVHWWIGEGFVPVRNGRLTTDAGEDCFSGLMNRCLIEAVDKTYSGKVETCKMHDMVRELVIRLADEDSFSMSNGVNFRRLGLKGDTDPKCLLKANDLSIKLRAVLSTTKMGEVNKIASSAAKKLCDFQYLRVLDLSKSIFETYIASVLSRTGSLQHLTYLNLSSTHPLIQVPLSIQNLKNLQVLNVSFCQNLRILPPGITSLEKLIVLDASNCGSLEYLPRGLGRLSNLQVLLGFRPARPIQSSGCQIAELKRLTKLRNLGLHLTRADELGDGEVNDVLLNLHQLQFLTISCFDCRNSSDLITKLENLTPPKQLHELCLKFFPGHISPIWLNPDSLPMLRYLSISSGNLAKMSRRFWGNESLVWKVEGLMLESLLDLEEEWAAFQLAMPQLRVTAISWCPKLESFPVEEVGFRGGVWKKEE